jgi:putative endonuclease
MSAFVYILLCADRSYYVGSATGDDLTQRVAQHYSGFFGGYTSTRRPVQLVWSQHFDRITDAIAAERQLKGWSRAKKEALIRGDWSSVQRLAKRRAGKSEIHSNAEQQHKPITVILRRPRTTRRTS